MTISVQFRCVIKFSVSLFCFVQFALILNLQGSLSVAQFFFNSKLLRPRSSQLLTHFSGLKIMNRYQLYYSFFPNHIDQLFRVPTSGINFYRNFGVSSTISIDDLSIVFFCENKPTLRPPLGVGSKAIISKITCNIFPGHNWSQDFRCSSCPHLKLQFHP